MSWRDGLIEAVAEFLRRRDLDVVQVLDFEDRTEYGGYCETCAYEYAVVQITYTDSKGKLQSYTYNDSFSNLLREL